MIIELYYLFRQSGYTKTLFRKVRHYQNWKLPEDKIEDIKNKRVKVEAIIGHLKKTIHFANNLSKQILTTRND